MNPSQTIAKKCDIHLKFGSAAAFTGLYNNTSNVTAAYMTGAIVVKKGSME